MKGRFIDGNSGSAVIAVLGVVALLTLLAVTLLQSVRLDRIRSASVRDSEQAALSAESALSSAQALLLLATSNRPAYVVGQESQHAAPESTEAVPALLLGASNLTNEAQVLPLFSYDLGKVSQFPRMTQRTVEEILTSRLVSNPSLVVDLNDPALDGRMMEETNPCLHGGRVAPRGRYPALWQNLYDQANRPAGRFAFVLTDETGRLNPALHTGIRTTNPLDWYAGPSDIGLTNGPATHFPSPDEAAALKMIATNLPSEEAFAEVFGEESDRRDSLALLTRDPCRAPDLIPASFPEGGLPKYNLNDLATNPAWGRTPYDRATNIAGVISRNLPKFRERDASLKPAEQDLYLRRLACSLVDYIKSDQGPTGPPGGEPSGRDLVPYVTQIGELCARTSLTPTNTSISSRFFVEVWNPTTSVIPPGKARITIGNRARVKFGRDIASAFPDYDETTAGIPALKPNEFTVIPFREESREWISPEATTNPPSWDRGPAGNATNGHQWFEFRWNDRLVDLSRRPPISPGSDRGGLAHEAKTLSTTNGAWQIWTIPTWGPLDNEETADEALTPGQYRFVGDPRAGFETAYVWKPASTFERSRWKGINPASERGAGFVLDPMATWTARDRIPANPATGNLPVAGCPSPDLIPSPYVNGGSSSQAPCVIRKGPMKSLGELGNIFDPAQIDDQGGAPAAGTAKSKLCCGGGRTLRIGQPEFHFTGTSDWDLPGKRAADLLDLFTVADKGREPGPGGHIFGGTNSGIPGRINLNTASSEILENLFLGIRACSDNRYPDCRIGSAAARSLAEFVIRHRPYGKLSDLSVLAAPLSDAETFSPWLGKNIPGSARPLANVFDRAREEAFGRLIGHVTVQTRVFRIHAVGEALDRSGRPVARALVQAIIRLEPDSSGRLIPTLHDIHWR